MSDIHICMRALAPDGRTHACFLTELYVPGDFVDEFVAHHEPCDEHHRPVVDIDIVDADTRAPSPLPEEFCIHV
jgi:hypothetical protein